MDLLLTDQKIWITNAIADVFLIWAFDKDKNVHGFLVDKNSKVSAQKKLKNLVLNYWRKNIFKT